MRTHGLGEPLQPSDFWGTPDSFDPTMDIPEDEPGGGDSGSDGTASTLGNEPKKKRRGFFGFIFSNLFTIIGTALSPVIGPVGIAVGRRIDNSRKKANLNNTDNKKWYHYAIGLNGAGVSVGSIEDRETYSTLTDTEADNLTTITGVVEYPMSEAENLKLAKWLELFKETINNLAKKIDTVIIMTKSNPTGKFKTQLIIDKANLVLKEIATFRAYNKMILEYGEKGVVQVLGKPIKVSNNYAINKANFTEYYLNILEKSVLEFTEENLKIEGIKLIKSEFIASEIKSIELVDFNWQNKKIASELKKYVFKDDQSYYNAVEIKNIDTSDTPTPATNGEGENVVELPSKTPLGLKILAFFGLVYVGKKLLE